MSNKGGIGGYGMDGRTDRKGNGGMNPDNHHGYAGQHGFGPHGGEYHLKKGARISDKGALGGKDRGPQRGELGSHGGARRNNMNPGSGGGRSSE